MNVQCDLNCGDPIDPREIGTRSVYVLQEAYARPGEHGGSDMALRKPHRDGPGYAHAHCVHLAQHNIDPRQVSLV
jgi:hypothetical protein